MGETESWSLAAFTLAVLGVAGSGAVIGLYDAAATTRPVEDVVPALIGGFTVAAAVPVVVMLMAEAGKRRVDRAQGGVHGLGLAHAAEILSVIALLVVLAWAALTVLEVRDARNDESSATQPSPAHASSAIAFGAGVLTVGSDIKPGRYESTTARPDCEWERLSGFSGTPESVIEKGRGDGSPTVEVEIQPGDAGFSSFGCGTWAAASS